MTVIFFMLTSFSVAAQYGSDLEIYAWESDRIALDGQVLYKFDEEMSYRYMVTLENPDAANFRVTIEETGEQLNCQKGQGKLLVDVVLNGETSERVYTLVPSPSTMAPEIIDVPDEEEIEEEIEIDLDNDFNPDVIEDIVVFEEEEKEEEVFMVVETSAAFPGGMAAFQNQFKGMFDQIQATRIFVEFIVEKDGSVTNIRSVRGDLTEELEEQLTSLIRKTKWQPGLQRGEPVRHKMVRPVMIGRE